MPLRTALAATLLFSVVIPIGRGARADIVSLRNGGEIRGGLLDDAKSKGRGETVMVRTLTGATGAIVRGAVDAVVGRRVIVEEYGTRRPALDDTVEAHSDRPA